MKYSLFLYEDRIIAMGFPSENVESIYRNSLDEVRKLLEEKHKVNRIFNLFVEDGKSCKSCLVFYPTSLSAKKIIFSLNNILQEN